MNRIKSILKKRIKTSYCYLFVAVYGLISCSENIQITRTIGQLPDIVPDYKEVTIPSNIAPLCFKLKDSCRVEGVSVIFKIAEKQIEARSANENLVISPSTWKKLMENASGKTIETIVRVKKNGYWAGYSSFPIYVADEPIDPYLAYRLIEPGYEVWNEMGIYQRCLEDFTESTIVSNEQTGYNCMNCHSFCMQDPDKMLFHMRSTFPGTILIDGDRVEKLNTKTEQTHSPLVYPSWHPSGNFIAFSVNDTKQAFHTTDKNRIEVFDASSDVVVYDVKKHEIITVPQLFSKDVFETFPTFSADGKTLFFCSSEAFEMPSEYEKVRYSLCSIAFNPERRTFGTKVDTLFNAREKGRSVSFPRVSPDGKFLMFTLAGYGNFSIWHKDADLYMIDLKSKREFPLDTLNSPDVESYHSWSSNSRWVVFSSRRLDGLYTRPYIAYVDQSGKASKPFLLPQKDVDFYDRFMKSYNIPEFVTGKVKHSGYSLSKQAINDKGIDVQFGGFK